MRVSNLLLVAAGVAALAAAGAKGAVVTLTTSDTLGNSSFNSAGGWSDSQAPHSDADYLVDSGIRLRTPADGGSYTFGGNSLTLGPNGTTGYNLPGGELMYKGTGITGVITINNLILNGGSISHADGTGDVFQLAGNMSVTANSTIYPKQGSINIEAPISGSATITDPGSDGLSASRALIFSSTSNTFTGNLVIGDSNLASTAAQAEFILSAGSNLNFVIGANGVSNSVSGVGVAEFDGVFDFDLSGADATPGDSWVITNVAKQYFVPQTTPASPKTFTVNGFTDNGNNTWSEAANGVVYTFDESTGVLSAAAAVPEPASLGLIGVGGLLLMRRRRCRV